MQTKLIYMEEMQQYYCEAKVLGMHTIDGKIAVTLDQTVFYPQGGGQPYDTGIICNDNGMFKVSEVRYEGGMVHHFGMFEIGEFKVGDTVKCEVDVEKRKTNTRLHSIGHLIDMAIKELGLDWKPGKGYHFPNGAYVEYKGGMRGRDSSELIKFIEDKSNDIISRKISTSVKFSETQTQDGKPLRTVYYGEVGVPCGGTHVANLVDIGIVTIRKVKQDKENIRVSYL